MQEDRRKEESEQEKGYLETAIDAHADETVGIAARAIEKRMKRCTVCGQPTWQKGMCLKCRIESQAVRLDKIEHDMGATTAAVEMALAMSLHPFGLRLERLGPLVDDPTTPTQTLALLKHLCWCCYQMGAGQEWNWPPTEDNINSQRDAVKFQVATLAKKGSLNPQDNHDNWMKFRLEEGWVHGPVKDIVAMTHPDLVPYDELPEVERAKDDMDILAFNAGLEILLRRGGPTDIRWHYPKQEAKLPPNPVDLAEEEFTPGHPIKFAGGLHFKPSCEKCGSETFISSGSEQTLIDVPFYIDGVIRCKNKKCRHTVDLKFHVTGLVIGPDEEEEQTRDVRKCFGQYDWDPKSEVCKCDDVEDCKAASPGGTPTPEGLKHDHEDDGLHAGCPACDEEYRQDYEADVASDAAVEKQTEEERI